jgi:hypothetical protein
VLVFAGICPEGRGSCAPTRLSFDGKLDRRRSALTVRTGYHLLLDSEQETDRRLELDASGSGDDRNIFLIVHGVDSPYEEAGIHFQLTTKETNELVECLQKLLQEGEE